MAEEELRFNIEARDRASSVLQQIAREFRQLHQAVEEAARRMGAALRGLTDHLQRLAASITSGIGRALETLGKAAAVAAAGLTAALVAAGRAGFDFNLSLRGVQAGLTAILGSSDKATQLLGGLKQVAKDTQLTFKEVAKEGLGLAAAYGPQGFGRVIPTLRAFDAIQKGLMVDTESVQRALLGFRQLLGRPFAQQEELNQIGENLPGFDYRGILTKQFGTADTEALKKAKVTGRQVADALVEGMQERFGSLSGARGLGIIVSGFADVWDEFTGRITAGALPKLEAALEKILTAVSRLGQSERFIKALSVPFDLLTAALDAAADRLPQFTEWLQGIVTRENVVKVLAEIAGWIETITAKIAEFFGVATANNGIDGVFETAGKIAEAVLDRILQALGYVAGVIGHLVQNRDQVAAAFKAMFSGAVDAVDALIGGVATLIEKLEVLEKKGIGGMLLPGGKGDWKSGVPSSSPGAAPMSGRVGSFRAGFQFPDPSKIPLPGPFGPLGPGGIFGTPDFLKITPRDLLMIPPVPPGTPYVRPSAPTPGEMQNEVQRREAMRQELIRKGRGIREGAGRAAAGATPPDFLGGLDRAGQEGARRFSLAEIRRQQEEAARRRRAEIERALPKGPKGAADSGIPPSTIIGEYQPGAKPKTASPEEIKEHQKALGAYFDAMKERARVALEGAPEERRAREEAARLIPLLQQEIQQSAIPELQRAKQGTAEWYKAYREGVRLEGEISDLKRKAAKEAAQEAQKQAREAKEVSEGRLKLLEAQVKNLPGLSDRQREQQLIPALMQRYRELQQAPEGEKESERLERLTQAEGVKGRIMEAAGLGGKRGIRLLGAVDPRLVALRKMGVFKGLSEEQNAALFGGGALTGINPQLRGAMESLFSGGGGGGPEGPGGAAFGSDAGLNARQGALRYALRHAGGGSVVDTNAINTLANRNMRGGQGAQIMINVHGYTAADIAKQVEAATLKGLRDFDPAPSPYD